MIHVYVNGEHRCAAFHYIAAQMKRVGINCFMIDFGETYGKKKGRINQTILWSAPSTGKARVCEAKDKFGRFQDRISRAEGANISISH